MKRRFRLLWHEPAEAKLERLSSLLAIAPAVVADAVDTPYFGLGWSRVERASPRLAAERVRFVDLPREMKIAQAIHRRLSHSAGSSDWDVAELTAA